MKFTEKLNEVLSWIGSHSQRLSRKGMELPNHLASATVRLFPKELGPTFDLQLDARGRPPDLQPDFPVARIEVRDAAGQLLFADDYPQGINP